MQLVQKSPNVPMERRSPSSGIANYVSRYRRSCIRRGVRCDSRPNDCCNNSSCRCNLWGPTAAAHAWDCSSSGGNNTLATKPPTSLS